MERHIVFTRVDGSVAIATASRNWLQVVSNGGYPWFTNRGNIDRAIENRVKAGISREAAWRHVKACAFGGYTSGEAMEVIRDNAMDINRAVLCVDAFAPEVWRTDDFGQLDRWFRDAWRRSQNGGPIYVELGIARVIQAQRILDATQTWNAGARRDSEIAFLAGRRTNGPAIVRVDRERIQKMIKSARTPAELRTVWPDDLPIVT